MDSVDVLVIGAGVVGLAVARAFAATGREVLVLEQADAIGTGVSSRSSEVLHAGLHYPAGSLKARLCVHGRSLLYDYCARRGIAHRRCGKLVVAGDDAAVAELDRIANHAAMCGVDDLVLLDRAASRRLEPALDVAAALLSPSSGIVDSHALMLSLLADAEDHGATLALRARVEAIHVEGDAFVVRAGETALRARWVINAAGLQAVDVARRVDGFPAEHVPRAFFAKGHYFAFAGRAPFSHLVYPLPEPGGLGIHLTLDLGGQARFGPDVEWIEAPDYTVDAARAPAFERSVRRWWPGLPDGALQPAYAGVRPKIVGPGEPAADFRLDGPAQHGVRGLVHCFGIESPGLTACLAIADAVLALLNATDASSAASSPEPASRPPSPR